VKKAAMPAAKKAAVAKPKAPVLQQADPFAEVEKPQP